MTALERTEEAFREVTIERDGQRFVLVWTAESGTARSPAKQSKETLARVAFSARATYGDEEARRIFRESVRWTGTIPADGLAGWEREALQFVKRSTYEGGEER